MEKSATTSENKQSKISRAPVSDAKEQHQQQAQPTNLVEQLKYLQRTIGNHATSTLLRHIKAGKKARTKGAAAVPPLPTLPLSGSVVVGKHSPKREEAAIIQRANGDKDKGDKKAGFAEKAMAAGKKALSSLKPPSEAEQAKAEEQRGLQRHAKRNILAEIKRLTSLQPDQITAGLMREFNRELSDLSFPDQYEVAADRLERLLGVAREVEQGRNPLMSQELERFIHQQATQALQNAIGKASQTVQQYRAVRTAVIKKLMVAKLYAHKEAQGKLTETLYPHDMRRIAQREYYGMWRDEDDLRIRGLLWQLHGDLVGQLRKFDKDIRGELVSSAPPGSTGDSPHFSEFKGDTEHNMITIQQAKKNRGELLQAAKQQTKEHLGADVHAIFGSAKASLLPWEKQGLPEPLTADWSKLDSLNLDKLQKRLEEMKKASAFMLDYEQRARLAFQIRKKELIDQAQKIHTQFSVIVKTSWEAWQRKHGRFLETFQKGLYGGANEKKAALLKGNVYSSYTAKQMQIVNAWIAKNNLTGIDQDQLEQELKKKGREYADSLGYKTARAEAAEAGKKLTTTALVAGAAAVPGLDVGASAGVGAGFGLVGAVADEAWKALEAGQEPDWDRAFATIAIKTGKGAVTGMLGGVADDLDISDLLAFAMTKGSNAALSAGQAALLGDPIYQSTAGSFLPGGAPNVGKPSSLSSAAAAPGGGQPMTAAGAAVGAAGSSSGTLLPWLDRPQEDVAEDDRSPAAAAAMASPPSHDPAAPAPGSPAAAAMILPPSPELGSDGKPIDPKKQE